jgi:hypothetical protein
LNDRQVQKLKNRFFFAGWTVVATHGFAALGELVQEKTQ